LNEKGDTVHTLADRKHYADYLETIPVFSSCSREVLESFVTSGVVKVHCWAGKKLSPLADGDQNLYVVATGSAILHAGDDVTVDLEPGDYFGQTPQRRHHIGASVVAVTDVEILVINPQEVAWLQQASSRYRHPSKTEWQNKMPAVPRRSFRRTHRRGALVTQAV
jgi:hypothetical protein